MRYNQVVKRIESEYERSRQQWEQERIGRYEANQKEEQARLEKAKHNTENLFLDNLLYHVYPGEDVPLIRGDLYTYLTSFQKMLWVFVGVNTIAFNAALVPGKIFEKHRNKLIEVHDHPLLELLENPNNIHTEYEILLKTFAFTELTGNCYWFLEKPAISRNGQIFNKIVVPRPDRVEPKLLGDDDIRFYREGISDAFTSETVVHFANFNPLLTHSGYPTVAPGGNNLLLDWYLELYGNQFFKVGVQPTMAFKVPGRMSKESEDRFRIDLKRLHEGVDNMFRALILQNGMDTASMNMKTPVDTEYVTTKRSTRDNILMNLGCYHLVALLQERSGESIKIARKIFWEETMLPRIRNHDQAITKGLLKKYPDSKNLIYKSDTRQVSGLRDDLLDESLAYFRLIQSKVLGHRQVGEIMGYPEMDPEDTTGIGYEPALSRTVSNPEREILEDTVSRIEEKRRRLRMI